MANSYYIPPHLSKPFTKEEITAYVEVFREGDAGDGDADGFIDADSISNLLTAVNEKITVAKVNTIQAECDPHKTGNLGFLDILKVLGKLRRLREPFGGKRAITSDLPLPLRIATEYDKPCLQHPERRAQMENPADPTATMLRMVFNRHDVDGSGSIEMQEVKSILSEHGLTFDPEILEGVFKRFDVDGGGSLDFGEFVEMMTDLKAESAIVAARGPSYDLPQNLARFFTPKELAELKVNFGVFDVDGGGSIAAHELKSVLEDLGHSPTDEQVALGGHAN